MRRVSPGVVRERHCNRNERRQLLRSSAATVFILPFDVRVASIVGVTGKLASKTPGWVLGQPVAGGIHGYLGVSLALP